MKIAFFGSGSIACYIGGLLSNSKNEVVLYGRSYMQKCIIENGLTLTDYKGNHQKFDSSQINYSTNITDIRDSDLIIITVKSHATQSVLDELCPIVSKSTRLISLQNGVHNYRLMRSIANDHQVANSMVPYNVVNQGDGHFHRGTEGQLIFERCYETGLLVEELKKVGLEAELSDDIYSVLWGKLLLNLNNALNTLSNLPLKEQLSDRNFRLILAKCIDEGLTLLNKANIVPAQVGKVPPQHISKILSLPNFLFKIVANSMLKIDPQARSSMWEDLQAGRESEIDYLNGELISLATQMNEQLPINQVIYDLVKECFAVGKSPEISGKTLRELTGC